MTPMLEAQNISGLQKEQPLLLLEENLEQLSIGNEEEYGWEDELEELSRCDFDSRRISKIVTLYSPVIFNSANVFPRNVESDFTPTRNRF